MTKFLLFACITLCGIHAVPSIPQKRSIEIDGILALPLTKGGNSAQKNQTNTSCSCSINATNFGSMVQPPNFPEIQNVLPSATTSASAFVWKCSLVPNRTVRDDYHYSPGIGSHKLHTRPKVWNEARKLCNEEGGYLAIINSQAEANLLAESFNKSSLFKGGKPDQILLGIHDLYTEGDWASVKGDSLAKTGYSAWSSRWGGQPDNSGGIQNCGALMEDGTLDDVSCALSQVFFCEIDP